MNSIEGKVALVTGGAGGLGLAMIKKLLNCGAKGIAIVDISDTAGEKALEALTSLFGDKKVIFIKADITNKQQFKDAFETTIRTYNQLDIVINNAGIVDEVDREKTLAVNLGAVIEGTYLAMQEYLPKYKTGPEGVIVNIASILGLEAAHIPLYCATKHGIVGLGRALGGEEFYKKYKVRVLTICPAVVATGLTEKEPNVPFPDKFSEELKASSPVFQSSERVGEALIYAIKNGKTGSLWVTENEEPVYEVAIPPRRSMRV